MMHKSRHDLLEFFLTHLPMSHTDTSFRTDLLYEIRQRVNGFNPVMNDVHLSAPFELEVDRILDNGGLEFHNDRLNSESISRRCFDHRHVPQPAERHV